MYQLFRIRGALPAILICVCVIHVINANCPPGWKAWRDSCYILLAEKLNWFEASRACGRPNSGLVVPNTLEENNFIRKIQKEYEGLCRNGENCALRIGCAVQKEGLICHGQTRAPVFTYWSTDLGQAECVSMSAYYDGKWKYSSCSNKQFVVCEMPRHRVHVYCLTMAADGRVKPQCLHGYEIKNVTAKGVIECGDACWAEPRCRSFNLWQGGQHEICQLNNATLLESDEDDVIYHDECNYFGPWFVRR